MRLLHSKQPPPPRVEGDDLALPEPDVGTGVFGLLVGPAGHLVRAVEAVHELPLVEELGQLLPPVFVPLPPALEVWQGGQQVAGGSTGPEPESRLCSFVLLQPLLPLVRQPVFLIPASRLVGDGPL